MLKFVESSTYYIISNLSIELYKVINHPMQGSRKYYLKITPNAVNSHAAQLVQVNVAKLYMSVENVINKTGNNESTINIFISTENQ